MGKDLVIEDLSLGDGPVAERGSRVAIRYDGFLNGGDAFRRNHDVTFTLGRREVIAGLERGLLGMATGGKRRLTIGAHLAYGAHGVPGFVPENALLILDVQLLSVANG